MAQFTKLSDNSYKIDGELTLENVERINRLAEQTYLVLDNTRGQRSEIINGITNENILFRVLGGLDSSKKKKYDRPNYIARTEVSPSGLSKVVEYYENIERQIDPNWTDTQKAMFLYGYMAEDIDYTDEKDKAMDNDVNSAVNE